MTAAVVVALVALAILATAIAVGRRFRHWSFHVEIDRNGHRDEGVDDPDEGE